jgi:hypothetical protein
MQPRTPTSSGGLQQQHGGIMQCGEAQRHTRYQHVMCNGALSHSAMSPAHQPAKAACSRQPSHKHCQIQQALQGPRMLRNFLTMLQHAAQPCSPARQPAAGACSKSRRVQGSSAHTWTMCGAELIPHRLIQANPAAILQARCAKLSSAHARPGSHHRDLDRAWCARHCSCCYVYVGQQRPSPGSNVSKPCVLTACLLCGAASLPAALPAGP